MPELVANGPIIPVRLMNELDGGKAVFFCGAGISMGPASDLPSFNGLLDHVYKTSQLEPDAVETEALDLDKRNRDRRRPNLDKAFGLLERQDRLGAHSLRRIVVERLSTRPKGELVTHKALLRLSRAQQGVRLVTTNFDSRFVEAGHKEQLVDTSPKLPVPKPHCWSSLVHLHGRIVPGDNGASLVLTAADFGCAYLTERWAARFITELFREFTVVFVGYSLGDPVMSYMVDALAAERAKGARFATAYAFAEYEAGGPSKERVRDGWLAKNVEPILYDKRADHKLLSDTLVEWARIRSDAYQARTQIALNEISRLPGGSSNPVVERVSWALLDPVAAEALAIAPPISDEDDFPKLESWLDVFAEAGLLSRDAHEVDVDAGDHNLSTVRLVDGGDRSRNPAPLHSATFQLGRWIARHLHVPQVLAWVLKNGGHMHPFLRDEVRRNLANPVVEVPAELRHYWTILVDSEPIDRRDLLWTSDQLQSSLSESERRRLEEHVIKSFAPRLVLRPGPSPRLRFRQHSHRNPKPHSPLKLCGHLVLTASDQDHLHNVQEFMSDIRFLGRSAHTLTDYLDQALTLLTDDDESHLDTSWVRPSIAPHDQNHQHDSWTHLIDLVRDSYFGLAAIDSRSAANLLERWTLSPRPLFRRLALNALTEYPKSDIRLVKRLLVTGRRPGLWETELRREVLRFLRLAGSRIPRSLRAEVVRAVHSGPKSKPKRSINNYDDIIHREKAKRLRKLNQSGAKLDRKSTLLAAQDGPLDVEADDDFDEFLFWTGEARFVAREEFAPQDLLAGRVADVAAAVSRGQIGSEEFEGLGHGLIMAHPDLRGGELEHGEVV